MTVATNIERQAALTPGQHRVGRDIVVFAAGTVLSGVFGVLQVFIIPRLVSVEDFGYWRLFALYAGYAGLLHLGFPDGALLCWAGRELDNFRTDLRASVRFLLVQQLALVVPAAIAVAVIVPRGSPVQAVFLGVLACAVIMNLVTLLQFTLQASRQFLPVAIATLSPLGVFVTVAFAVSFYRTLSFRSLILFYLAGWISVLVFLWCWVRPMRKAAVTRSWEFGRRSVALGWPIMLATAGFGFVQSADRLVLSSAASIYDFAHYSMAASTMFVPMTIITAISRVFFPHLAAADREQHQAMYQQGSRLVLLAWTVLLPYYIFVDLFVRHFLPKYEVSLPIARVLVLGVLFFGSIQILQMNVFNLYGQQRRFFVYSAVAVSCSLGLAYVGARHFHSLVMVATTQVIMAGAWWSVNAWKLRHITHEHSGDWRRTLLLFVWSAVSLWLAMNVFHTAVLQLCAYYALIAIPTWVCFRGELVLLARFSGSTRLASAMLLARPGDEVGD